MSGTAVRPMLAEEKTRSRLGRPKLGRPKAEAARPQPRPGMHELALTESILRILEDQARSQAFSRVRAVKLRIGALGHVDGAAIRFCFGAVMRGTLAEGARLQIENVPGQALCLPCGRRFAMANRFDACPDCCGHHLRIVAGDEMRVGELEVE